jgi:gamma-glutamylputrescine oxidase
MTVSLWQRSSSPETIDADVAIIGGGVTGLSAALACEERGVSTVLLERHTVASGASGRNAGYLMRGMAESYAVAVAQFGHDRAREIWGWSESNLHALRRLGAADAAGFADRASCLIALSDDESAELESSSQLLREDGFDVELIRPPAEIDALWASGRVKLGLVNPGDAVCHPVRLMELLRLKLTSTRIAENAEVFDIERVGAGVTVHARGLRVRAKHACIATNAWAGRLCPSLAGAVLPRRGQMLAAEPDAEIPLRYAYYLNRGSEYLRTGPSGELIIGGARALEPAEEAAGESGVAPVVQERLELWLRDLVTTRYRVTARWSGVMGFTSSGLPLVGRAPHEGITDDAVWVCAGFTGHGMSLGHLAGRAAAEAMLGYRGRPELFELPQDHAQPSPINSRRA